MRFPSDRAWWRGLAGSLAMSIICSLPCGAAEEPKDKPKAETGEKAAEKTPDPFAIPEGGPQDLLEFLDKLKSKGPEKPTMESMMEFRGKYAKASLEAADKILAAKPNDEQAQQAVKYKLDALSMLGQMGDESAMEKLKALPEELRKAGMPALAHEADGTLLSGRLRKAMGNKDDLPKLIDDINAHFQQGPLTRRDASLAMMAGSIAERGDATLAAKLYKGFAEIFAKSENKDLARLARRMEGSARRVTLVGEPIRLEGKTLEGEKFDWAPYRGKIVLVDFWATWCGPCVAEGEHVKKVYKLWHERGFDVVGVDLDDSPEPVKAFVKDHEIPWAIIYDKDAGDDQLADYYGIYGIPTVALVDKEGKVISMDVRGPKLEEQLTKLLGPAEMDKKEGSDDSKPAADKPEKKGKKDKKKDSSSAKSKKNAEKKPEGQN